MVNHKTRKLNMTIEEVNQFAKGIMEELGLEFIPFTMNDKRSRKLGRYFHPRKEGDLGQLEITKVLLTGSIEAIKDVVKHEIAHYYTYMNLGRHTHDTRLYIDTCNKIGANPAPKSKVDLLYKYEVICSECGDVCGQTEKMTGWVKSAKAGTLAFTSGCCGASLNLNIYDWE